MRGWLEVQADTTNDEPGLVPVLAEHHLLLGKVHGLGALGALGSGGRLERHGGRGLGGRDEGTSEGRCERQQASKGLRLSEGERCLLLSLASTAAKDNISRSLVRSHTRFSSRALFFELDGAL